MAPEPPCPPPWTRPRRSTDGRSRTPADLPARPEKLTRPPDDPAAPVRLDAPVARHRPGPETGWPGEVTRRWWTAPGGACTTTRPGVTTLSS